MHEVILPKTGIYMDDVFLVEWLAEEGTQVEAGQPVILMETNKVEQEVEADGPGYLHQTAPAGGEYPIGTQVGVIVESHEEYLRLVEGEA